jgi:hypothetical protein
MDIARQRLIRTFLATCPWSSGRDVVRALGAVQAQDYDGAKWALAQRATGATDDSIEREFAAGNIVRTHVLRPTWHFIDPLDIRWMLALTGPRVKKTMSSYDLKLGLDDKVFRRSRSALEKALRDGQHLTRAELKSVLARAKIADLGVQRTAHLMMRAELDAVICSGPRRGRQFTYALLEERVPAVPGLDRDEALLTLTLRYFGTRAPATASDFGWWSGLAMSDVRRGIELARDHLHQEEIGGETYWCTSDSITRPKPSAHLLPNYDEYFIGYRNRSAIGTRLKSVKAVTGANFVWAHVIAIDGQLVGGWRRTVGRESTRLDLELLTRLTPAERTRLAAAVRRYGAFIGRPVELHGLADR